MRPYLKAFLFLVLTASIACVGADFVQAAETALLLPSPLGTA